MDYFSITYAQARTRFREAAARVNAQQLVYPIPVSMTATDPTSVPTIDPETDLTIDVAIVGDRQLPSALVVSSGCHGVEGFLGSAIQLAFLESLAPSAAKLNGQVVLIHAINPYGFHHLRRFNEDNVDLNRNFLADGEAYQGSPSGYPDLDPFLNPPTAPSWFEPFRLKALWSILRWGMPALMNAIAGGQYEFPRGLFYGGRGPCASTLIVQQQMEAWVGPASQIVHLDLHSGLGKSGTCQLLLTESAASASYRWFCERFGTASIEPDSGTDGTAYKTSGGMGQWLQSRFHTRQYRFATAEFGTFPAVTVLQALRTENRAHFYAPSDSNTTRRAKRQLLEVFCPSSLPWRTEVLRRGLEILHQSLPL